MSAAWNRCRMRALAWLACLAQSFAPAPAWGQTSPDQTAFALATHQALELEVGETRVIAAPGAHRVAVGNGQVVSAMATDGREVVLFARDEGLSSVHVWRQGQAPEAYMVRVLPAGLRHMQEEVDRLLKHIPAARSSRVGGNIVIEGGQISDSDRTRIAALSQRYPGILDFTGQVGWDRMVLLDVQVVELPRSRLREFGIRWDTSSRGGLLAGLAWDAGSALPNLAGRPGDQTLETSWPSRSANGYFGVNAMLAANLTALAQRGEAVMLAQPQLLARSGSTASFLAGGEVPYATTDSEGTPTTTFKPYGVSLQITPQIDRNGTIRSRIEVEASSVDASLTLPSGPAMRTRRASTEFNVRSGQTLVIGGFLSRERSDERSGLPWLSDIPLLGVLFGTKRSQLRDSELAIFVTPSVVGPDAAEQGGMVRRKQVILEQAFTDAPQLLPIPEPVPAPARGRGWSDPDAPGSQWQTPPASSTSFSHTVLP